MFDTDTIRRLIKAVQRENAMRVNVFPRWVASGRLTQAEADDERAAMRAILTSMYRAYAIARDAGTRVPLARQIKAAERELEFRRRAYPKFVRDGRLSRDQADAQLKDMREVLEVLLALQKMRGLLDASAKELAPS